MQVDDEPLSEKDIQDWVQWLQNFMNDQQDMPSDFNKILQDNYWDLLA